MDLYSKKQRFHPTVCSASLPPKYQIQDLIISHLTVMFLDSKYWAVSVTVFNQQLREMQPQIGVDRLQPLTECDSACEVCSFHLHELWSSPQRPTPAIYLLSLYSLTSCAPAPLLLLLPASFPSSLAPSLPPSILPVYPLKSLGKLSSALPQESLFLRWRCLRSFVFYGARTFWKIVYVQFAEKWMVQLIVGGETGEVSEM